MMSSFTAVASTPSIHSTKGLQVFILALWDQAPRIVGYTDNSHPTKVYFDNAGGKSLEDRQRNFTTLTYTVAEGLQAWPRLRWCSVRQKPSDVSSPPTDRCFISIDKLDWACDHC